MKVKVAAGTLLYRPAQSGGYEVLLVHPSGDYNRHKPWSIPKGMLDPGEDAETAARRETWEEAGIRVGTLAPLGEIQYRKSGKRVICFVGKAPDVKPSPNSWEIDRAEFFPLQEAGARLHLDQRLLLELLQAWLAENVPPSD